MANIRAYRISVPDAESTITIPSIGQASRIKKCVVKNVGVLNPMRISFSDDSPGNYWTLAPGAETPVFGGLRAGDVVITDGVGGATTMEVLIWEE